MATYHVAVRVTRPPSLGDPLLIRLLLDAAERATCVPDEITAGGLVMEADPVSIDLFEAALRVLLREHGAELDSLTVRRI